MGNYLNPAPDGFRESLNSPIYVDKTGLITELNRLICSRQKYVCVSRPRRFGKSMALDMLSAYYSHGHSCENLFEGLFAHSAPSFHDHLNQYDVLQLNMQEFVSISKDPIKLIEQYVNAELLSAYPDILYMDQGNMIQNFKDIYASTRRPFIVLIDEWDCLLRERRQDSHGHLKYLDFLRAWLKDKTYVGLVYMTGILPIKKYGTHSALNMFSEYSMIDPGPLSEYFGFREEEVKELCDRYSMDFDETRTWYDGYRLDGIPIYNPQSVNEAMLRHRFAPYWNRTETYEALKTYIDLDMNGLREDIIAMMSGARVHINPETFANDMTTFGVKDDVLTLLVHLGYLSYDPEDSTVSIPNKEVSMEYVNSISRENWGEVARAVKASRELLISMWNMDSDAVAAGVEAAHNEISILKYNDENSLSCTVSLALYYAREYYTFTREHPAGKGFADLVLTPRPSQSDRPAVIIELKRDSSPDSALEQIRAKGYAQALRNYKTLLVGITYDSASKKHSCKIERFR